MGTRTIGIIYALALFGLSACGRKDDPVAQVSAATTPDANGAVGGRCGEQVARDYQRLRLDCRFPRDRGEASRCRQEAEDFLHRYPSVSCTVSERDFRGEVRDRRIEAREIDDLLERLRRSGF